MFCGLAGAAHEELGGEGAILSAQYRIYDVPT